MSSGILKPQPETVSAPGPDRAAAILRIEFWGHVKVELLGGSWDLVSSYKYLNWGHKYI